MNIQTKAVTVALFGLIALGTYLAPFRQQAMNANHCVELYASEYRGKWKAYNKGGPTAEDEAWFRANAYGDCVGGRS